MIAFGTIEITRHVEMVDLDTYNQRMAYGPNPETGGLVRYEASLRAENKRRNFTITLGNAYGETADDALGVMHDTLRREGITLLPVEG